MKSIERQYQDEIDDLKEQLTAAEQERDRLREALEAAKELIWSEFATSNGISEGNSAYKTWQKLEHP